MQKNEAFIRSFRINTSFWCGRQELKTYDDMKKALKIKAFLLLNANVDAKIFFGEGMILLVLFNSKNKPNMERIVFLWYFT